MGWFLFFLIIMMPILPMILFIIHADAIIHEEIRSRRIESVMFQ